MTATVGARAATATDQHYPVTVMNQGLSSASNGNVAIAYDSSAITNVNQLRDACNALLAHAFQNSGLAKG
jgi:hypothetical protein